MRIKKPIRNSTPTTRFLRVYLSFIAFFVSQYCYLKKCLDKGLDVALGARAGYPQYSAAPIYYIATFKTQYLPFTYHGALRGTCCYPWRKCWPVIISFAQPFIYIFKRKNCHARVLRMVATAICLCVIFFTLPSCKKNDDKHDKVNLTPSFSPTDKNPLGLYVANQLLRQKFVNYDIYKNDKSFKEFYTIYTKYDVNRTGRVFCVLSQKFYPNEEDLEAITDFVSNGNTLFVAANSFDTSFLNRFHLKVKSQSLLFYQLAYHSDMRQTGLRMSDSIQFNRALYKYFFFPLNMEISRDDNYAAQSIAETEAGKTCGLVFKYGSGRVIVVTNATALTNYFLLTNNNFKYLQNLLAYTPSTDNSLKGDDKKNISTTGVTIDSYYNNIDEEGSGSPFVQLLKKPALAWAFWLLLLLAALWIYNGMIRRQRIIEVIKPNSNSSVEFAETVARLYLLKRDNKNIATKMITYFLEHVRTKYYLNTSQLNMEFAKALTAKTGLPIERSEILLETIGHIQAQTSVSDYSLLDLNTQIQKFLKV